MDIKNELHCFCGNIEPFNLCCEPVITGHSAQSPEQLMRSRYSAFVSHAFQYLLDTHHPDTLNGLSLQHLKDSAVDTHWQHLEVLNSSVSNSLHEDGKILEKGEVEFVATYKNNNNYFRLHEKSAFEKVDGLWFYKTGKEGNLSGRVTIGRNEPCPCSSGKKFKRCCG
jgi:SEC-C motif-containing protein